MKKLYKFVMVMICLFSFVLCSCTHTDNENTVSEGKCSLYYIDRNEIALTQTKYEFNSGVLSERLAEVIDKLSEENDSVTYAAPITNEFSINDYYMEGNQAVINLGSNYYDIPKDKEILIRGSIVKSLTSVDGIETVVFLIDGRPFLLSSGMAAGEMTADDFVIGHDLDENDQNEVEVNIYYADKMGNTLVKHPTKIKYSTSQSFEKQVLETLVIGPSEEGLYPVINPETVINSVEVKDGICTVDFSDDFFDDPYNISTDVAIYSIVNTLTDLNNITGVYFTINGDSTALFQNKYSLKNLFEFKEDIVGE